MLHVYNHDMILYAEEDVESHYKTHHVCYLLLFCIQSAQNLYLSINVVIDFALLSNLQELKLIYLAHFNFH